MCLWLFLVLLAGGTAADGAVVKLHRAKCIADTMAHVQYVRDIEMVEGDGVENCTTTSFLELQEDVDGVLKSKKFGFKYLEYFGDVAVNDKSYSMLFDTSTAHTWIPSASCSTCCHGQISMPPTQSSASQPMFEQFPDGTWYSGVSQTGSLTIGDLIEKEVDDRLKVPNFNFYQIFVKGHKSVLPAKDDCADSIIGLSFSTHLSDPQPNGQVSTQRELDLVERQQGIRMSFIDRLYHEHLMTAPIFSMFLTSEEEGSIIEFGSVDKGLIKRNLNPNGLFYVSAVGFPDFYWAFNVPRVCINDECFRVGNIPARISSSVPYIALPQSLYQAFRKPQERVPNPCQILKFLPTISFVGIGSDDANPSNRYAKRFDLCPKDYALVDDDGSCDFAIVPSKLNMIVLGTPFLRKFFTVFDIEQKRMGFAQSTDFCTEKVSSSDLLKMAQKAGVANKPEVVAILAKLANEEAKKPDEREPPLLQENVYLTYHKKFLN